MRMVPRPCPPRFPGEAGKKIERCTAMSARRAGRRGHDLRFRSSQENATRKGRAPLEIPAACQGKIANLSAPLEIPAKAPPTEQPYSSIVSSTGQWSLPYTSSRMAAPVTLSAMSSLTRK